MSERRAGKPPCTIDVVVFTALRDQLAVLLWRTPETREKWALPWDSALADETLEDAAARVATEAVRQPPSWLDQLGALGGETRHPSDSGLSVAFVGLVPLGTPPPVGGTYAWFPVRELPQLAPRQRAMLDAGIVMLRARMDQAPIAFKLLPPAFTLSELQRMYELLLDKRLHKASFRRALRAAWLVEPTDEWRSEGRGRPAQLFHYAPRKRRPTQRGIRFDLLIS